MTPEERVDALLLAEDLMADIELDRNTADKHVLKANRLARLVNDETILQWLHRERVGYSAQDVGTYYWNATHRGDDPKSKIYLGAVTLAGHVRTLQMELNNMKLPNLSGEMIALTIRETRNHIAGVRNQVLDCERVLASVSMLVHDFASRQYHALKFARSQYQLFESAKSSIDSLLGDLDAETLRKIDSAQNNLQAGDPEAIAAAMLNVRRLIDSVADAIFPATEETRTGGDGKPIKLGSEQRLNRVKAFIDDHARSNSRASRLKRATSDIYARVSTGVHDDVARTEAEALFLSAYVLLGEILGLKEASEITANIELK